MANPPPLTTEELARLEEQYRPFPAFSDWPTEVPAAELWKRYRDELAALKNEVADNDEVEKAIQVAVRAAAFDTGAIEGLYPTDRGLTRTVATQAAMWQQEVEARSKDALAFFEAQLRTYDLVLDVATQRMPVTEAWLRRLHEELTEPQDTYAVHTPIGPQEQPLPRGEYKRYPNHVETADGTIHVYAPVDQTAPEMERLVGELRSESFAHAHPILQAGYAHYALVAIHPFADGNGRVARALASVYLYRAASVPLLILAHQRDEYFAALAEADIGRGASFNDFLATAGRTAMSMVSETLRTALAPTVEEAISELDAVLGPMAAIDFDAAGARLAKAFESALSERIGARELPAGVTASAWTSESSTRRDNEFRRLSPVPRSVALQVAALPPAGPTVVVAFDVLVSVARDAARAFEIASADESFEDLSVSLAEVEPQISTAAHHRLHAFAERVLARGLQELAVAARKSLGRPR